VFCVWLCCVCVLLLNGECVCGVCVNVWYVCVTLGVCFLCGVCFCGFYLVPVIIFVCVFVSRFVGAFCSL